MNATPALKRLSGAYYHQDWMLLEDNEWDVLKDFLDHEPDLAPFLSGEIESVLDQFEGDDEVRDYLFGLGSCFTTTAEDGGYRGWLAEVGRRSRSAASTS